MFKIKANKDSTFKAKAKDSRPRPKPQLSRPRPRTSDVSLRTVQGQRPRPKTTTLLLSTLILGTVFIDYLVFYGDSIYNKEQFCDHLNCIALL